MRNSCSRAAAEPVTISDGIIDINVLYDGEYRQRGFIDLPDILMAISSGPCHSDGPDEPSQARAPLTCTCLWSVMAFNYRMPELIANLLQRIMALPSNVFDVRWKQPPLQ